MIRAIRIRLYPTPDQKKYLAGLFGAVRFCFNKALYLKTPRAAAVKEAIAEVQTLINLFNITASDVRFPEPGAKPRAKRSAGPVMYAFGDKTWTGHGRTPNWIKEHEANGGNRSDFLVNKED